MWKNGGVNPVLYRQNCENNFRIYDLYMNETEDY
jgi:hypothetical protein